MLNADTEVSAFLFSFKNLIILYFRGHMYGKIACFRHNAIRDGK